MWWPRLVPQPQAGELLTDPIPHQTVLRADSVVSTADPSPGPWLRLPGTSVPPSPRGSVLLACHPRSQVPTPKTRLLVEDQWNHPTRILRALSMRGVRLLLHLQRCQLFWVPFQAPDDRFRGGGWMELVKWVFNFFLSFPAVHLYYTERRTQEIGRFIEAHFADMFRLLPEPMPNMGPREEKRISSSSFNPVRSPRADFDSCPGSRNVGASQPGRGSGGMLLPSFALSSPSRKGSRSMKRYSSPGSPLTAHFPRRVNGEDSFLRPGTPPKSSPLRNQSRVSSLPSFPAIG